MKNTPVFIKPFSITREVECGFCNGTGTIDTGFQIEICRMCEGEGKLIDVRTGTIRLYTTDYKAIEQ
jgi:DnaJ-class molecular chaperone